MALDPRLELIRVLLLEFVLGREESVAGSDVVEYVMRLRQVEGF